ncbi:MAG: hypothetical protein CMN85_10925 [Spongiibacteraceae bacterium]|nr:hypothetical protein [Spongiibacteraceae bacterium]|tara:strand:+ start:16184 stop:16402 length:219 start_codon:yes stop_codon:yes gene_type:complete
MKNASPITRVATSLGRATAGFFGHFFFDFTAIAGLGMLGFGIWQWSQPAAYVTVGSIIFVSSLLGARAKAAQ